MTLSVRFLPETLRLARYASSGEIVFRLTSSGIRRTVIRVAHTPSRKLAVILHADVVGSTTLVHRDETLAHQRIRDVFRRFSKTIEVYGGIAHELRGDALIAEFDRASDAVAASLAFQTENTQFNSTLDDEIRPHLRIGVAMGEVVIADNTITGDGVVLAQRLE